MSEKQFEILSPAGSLATLKAAVNNGADAVYIGGKAFSARKNAVNFSDEEIVEAVHYAHLYGAKVYVTVNTLISDSELPKVYDFAKFLYENQVDALIIQDLGVLKMMRESFPDFEVHASTQMTIHNLAGARLAKELGFSRVVLSREMSFEEIKNISENVDIELEVFVHGALCMSYSGQCLMSSFLGARSGNRGACAQPCRLPYTLCDFSKKPISQKDKYLLSLKDLCLIDEMETLKECGVRSLKIEGRMKSTEYVSLVTSVYDKYRNGGKVSEKDYEALKSIFSRNGFTKGYLSDNTGRHMLNYDSNNDSVYDNINHAVLKRAEELSVKTMEKITFDARAVLSYNTPMTLTVCAKGKSVTVTGDAVSQKALNVSLDSGRVKAQISKTGSTPFVLGSFTSDIEEGLSLPIKDINDLRRKALRELESKLSHIRNADRVYPYKAVDGHIINEDKIMYNAEVRNMEQAAAAVDSGFDTIVVPYGLYVKNKAFFDSCQSSIALVSPPVMRDNRKFHIQNLPHRIYISNLSQFNVFKGKEIIADFRINAFNSHFVSQLKNMGAVGVCLSPEMNIRQISAMELTLPAELVVYGRVPVMTVQNCVVKSAETKCSCTDDVYFLKDRKGVYFPLFTDPLSCTNTIYNSAPIYMGDRICELPKGISGLRFIFTTETGDEVKAIYNKYRNGQEYDDGFTRGHYYRGV